MIKFYDLLINTFVVPSLWTALVTLLNHEAPCRTMLIKNIELRVWGGRGTDSKRERGTERERERGRESPTERVKQRERERVRERERESKTES